MSNRKHHLIDGTHQIITLGDTTGASPWVYTPEAAMWIIVLAIYWEYDTTAAAGDRFPCVEYREGSTVLSVPASGMALPEDEDHQISPFVGSNSIITGPTIHRFALPLMKIDSGYTLRDATVNMQVGDDMDNIALSIVKWRK